MEAWETLGTGIHVDATLMWTIYVHIVADQVHPSMAVVFPDGSGLLHQDIVPGHTAKMLKNSFRNMTKSSKCFIGLQIPVRCTGQTNPIHGVPTLLLRGIKGSVANVLVPDSTGHLQRTLESSHHRSGPCWQHEGDLHSIKQELLISWLICVCITYM